MVAFKMFPHGLHPTTDRTNNPEKSDPIDLRPRV